MNKFYLNLFLVVCFSFSLVKAEAQQKVSSDDLLYQALKLTKEGHYKQAITISEKALLLSPEYPDVHQLLGKLYLIEKNYEAANQHLSKALSMMPDNANVLHNLITLNTLTKNYGEALRLVNRSLETDPQNQELLLKKAGLLGLMNEQQKASDILWELHRQYPSNEKYRSALLNLKYEAAKQALKKEKPYLAEKYVNEALQVDSINKTALVLLMNISYAQQQIDSAIEYADNGLSYYPDDSLFLLKKASFLYDKGEYIQAAKPAQKLMRLYPSERDTAVYVNMLAARGNELLKTHSWNEAISILAKAHDLAPRNIQVIRDLTTATFELKQYVNTVIYARKGLLVEPGNTFLLMKEAAANEHLERYDEAFIAAQKAVQKQPDNYKFKAYADLLKGKTFTRQMGIIHLQSFYSNHWKPSSITSLQYMKHFGWGSLTARTNLKYRNSQTGVQLETELYYLHSERYYSHALASWSADKNLFPSWRLGYSLFRNFNKGWEGEIGSRYIYANGYQSLSGILSIGKYWGNNWTNIRGYAIHDNAGNWNQAYTLKNRFYLNDQLDYISILGALGTSPDDPARNFGTERVPGFLMKSVGAGFEKHIKYKWTVNFVAAYTNQRIPNNQSYNQYDFYITLLRNF